MLTLRKCNRILGIIEDAMMGTVVIALTVLVVVNIFMRLLLKTNLTFTEELGSASLVYICFMGIPFCARRASTIEMSSLIELIPRKWLKYVRVVIQLIAAALMIWFGVMTITYLQSLMAMGKVTIALRIPMWIIYLPIAVGFFDGALQNIVGAILNLLEKEKDVIYSGSEAIMSDVPGVATVLDSPWKKENQVAAIEEVK